MDYQERTNLKEQTDNQEQIVLESDKSKNRLQKKNTNRLRETIKWDKKAI